MSILDCSKIHMYSLYYEALKPKYENSTKLVYTNTDSHMLKIDTDDVYGDLQDMDFSGYHPSHPNCDKANKTVPVPGNFVDELNGRIITSFISLKPKYHCCKNHNEKEEHKKSKGVIKGKVKLS